MTAWPTLPQALAWWSDIGSAVVWLAGLVVLVLAIVLAWLWGPAWLRGWQRLRVRRQPFPPAWREVLRQRMPAFRSLPADLQLQAKKQAQVLLAEVPFIGCRGLVVTDEMRVLVAAQAALLLLNRPLGARFGPLRQVLLYPEPFVVRRAEADGLGLVDERARVLAGESWQQGQVVLSWPDVLAGAAVPDDGHNVVFHEFAHQLDQADGAANGAPWLPGARNRARWAATMQAEYAALQARLARGEAGLIDPYGATSPAEFFAVCSELFFERPQALAAAHPALYRELAGLYRTQPLAWH
jgi:Mlc titration factor MtfA (ptsG expression regulator)